MQDYKKIIMGKPGGKPKKVSISELAKKVEKEAPKLEKAFKEVVQEIKNEEEKPPAVSHVEFDVNVPVTEDFKETLSEILDAKLYNYSV